MKTLIKRWLATLVVFALCSAAVRADVTVVQTTTMEGGLAAMTGSGAGLSPKITTRVKGLKSRTDLELPPTINASSITDLVAKQLIVLQHDQKAAQTVDAATPAAPAPMTVKIDGTAAPSGKSQVIDGLKCDEYTFTTTMSLAEVAGGQLPPEAVEMTKGLSVAMKGSTWAKTAPGAAEYTAYQKALAKSDLAGASTKVSGIKLPGMDKMIQAMSSVDGVAYLTVMDLTVEGAGQLADMMRQMIGTTKVTIKVTSLSAEAIGDDLFKVPEGYTVVK